MAETEEELTPLKKKLDDFGTFLSKVPPDIGMLVFLSHAQKVLQFGPRAKGCGLSIYDSELCKEEDFDEAE